MATSKGVSQSAWRDVITVHPAADLFSLLGDAELRELGEDISQEA